VLFEYFAAELRIGRPDAVQIDVLDGKENNTERENNTVLTNYGKPLNSSRTSSDPSHLCGAAT
jgi:hypothetical protein